VAEHAWVIGSEMSSRDMQIARGVIGLREQHGFMPRHSVFVRCVCVCVKSQV
jgi:hypothetical protein